MGPSLDNFISWSLFQLKVIWGQIKFDKSQLVTGFNNSFISPVVKIAKTSVYGPVYGRTWLIRLEVWFRIISPIAERELENLNIWIW